MVEATTTQFWLTHFILCDGCTTLLAVVVYIFEAIHPKAANAKYHHVTVNFVIKDSVGMMFAFETPSAERLIHVGHHFLEKILAWWNLLAIVDPHGAIVIDSIITLKSILPSSIVNACCCLRIWYVAFFRRHRLHHTHSHHVHHRHVRHLLLLGHHLLLLRHPHHVWLHHLRLLGHRLLLRHPHHVWLHHLLLLESCLVLLL